MSPDSVKCGNHEEYRECGTRCGQGCEDLISGQTECSKGRLCVSGCFCLDGFYRNEIGECVPESQCPSPPTDPKTKECGENERYTDCGSQCGQSCEDAGKPMLCTRKRMCIAGCFCKKGFFRDKYDNCVTQRQCSEKGKGGGRKKPRLLVTEKPEDEDSTEEVTDGGTEEPHSDESIDDSHEMSSEGKEEEDSTEGTETDSTEITSENSGNESNEGTDDSSEESSTQDSGETTDDKSKNKKKGSDDGEPEAKPSEGSEEGSTEGSSENTEDGSGNTSTEGSADKTSDESVTEESTPTE